MPHSHRQQPLSAKLAGAPGSARSFVWAVDEAGSIFQLTASGKVSNRPLPSDVRALQIATSGTGEVWAIAMDRYRKKRLFKSAFNSEEWAPVFDSRGFQRIGGASDGGIWIIADGKLRHSDQAGRGSLLQPPFSPFQISQGADGTVWAIDQRPRFGGLGVWRYDQVRQQWFELPPPAAAKKIAGAPDGTAWSVNSRGDIWRLHPEGAGNFAECGANPKCVNCHYTPKQSQINDISVAVDGNVWFIEGGTSRDRSIIGQIDNLRTRHAVRFEQDRRIISIAAGMAARNELISGGGQPTGQ